jgi:hypothetical protein
MRRLSHSTPKRPLVQATDFFALHRIGNTQNLWRLTNKVRLCNTRLSGRLLRRTLLRMQEV